MNESSPIKNDSFINEKIRMVESDYIDLIHKRLGLVVHHQITELYQIIQEACCKFNCDPESYLNKLKNCPEDSPLIEHLILGITIGETYFFRDKNQMNLLGKRILPEIIMKKRNEGNLALRIWSTGSSSGEEIYSIVMMLYELLPDINQWTLNIIGTDINTKLLKKAMDGVYTEWSMRSITDYYKKRYFTHKNKVFLLDDKIKSLVNFFYLNLNDDTYPSIFNGTNAQDLILCRNVLIYFSVDNISDIMERIHSSLIPGGYLQLGASDPVNHSVVNTLFNNPHPALLQSTNTRDAKPKMEVKINVTPTIRNETPSKRLFEPYHPRPQPIEGRSASLLSVKALSEANLGHLDMAVQLCKQSLEIDPTNKFTYLVYSLILAELNHFNESETALRHAVFLDHEFVVAHFQLGLLLMRKKSVKQGLRCLHNALNIASIADKNKTVPGSQGITYGKLTEILQHEISMYEPGRTDYAKNT